MKLSMRTIAAMARANRSDQRSVRTGQSVDFTLKMLRDMPRMRVN
jgi:hypothetical protein